jgi:hypothetical protein
VLHGCEHAGNELVIDVDVSPLDPAGGARPSASIHGPTMAS